MQKHILKVEKREVFGKKLKKLRREGILPANIYGKGTASVAVQLLLKDFIETHKETGETGLLELHLGTDQRPALIHTIQLDYVTNQPLHVDFYQVNLKEKVKTMVPVVITGEPIAVKENLGTLLHMVSEVEVEALPTDLPEKFEIDIAHLAAVDDQVTVADLPKVAGVEILTEPSQIVAKIAELVAPEPEPEPEVAEGAEGEVATEGEAAKVETGEKGESTSAENSSETKETPKE